MFTLKYNLDNMIHQYKECKVARKFSLIICLNSVRIILSFAINQEWSLQQLDVYNAFLYDNTSKTVYMEQPPGYEVEGESNKVYLLHRALYDLKQSLWTWFTKFTILICKGSLNAKWNPVFRKTTSAIYIILVVC